MEFHMNPHVIETNLGDLNGDSLDRFTLYYIYTSILYYNIVYYTIYIYIDIDPIEILNNWESVGIGQKHTYLFNSKRYTGRVGSYPG